MRDVLLALGILIVGIVFFITFIWVMKDTDKFGWIWDGFTTSKEDLEVNWEAFEKGQR